MGFVFAPASYGAAVEPLLTSGGPCELGPGRPNRAVETALRQLDDSALFSGQSVAQPEMGECCRSALWLRHNFLHESHAISQEIASTTGSYWHGIMHRREPDFSNAKYWFRRVGQHPVFAGLSQSAAAAGTHRSPDRLVADLIQARSWDPFRFVDLCALALEGRTDAEFCRDLAELEWQLLFDFCYRQAIGAE